MTTATSAEAMKSRDEPIEANRAIAIELLEAGAAGRAREVMRRYAAPDLIHHNPTFASDAATLAAAMDENAGSNPYTVLEILRTIAEGPLVAVHSRVRAKPGDTPVATAHIFRIEDGMIHELWDIAQDLPADSPNEAGMFCAAGCAALADHRHHRECPARRASWAPWQAVDSAAMNGPAPRRIVILTEGQWHVHNAKTAMGVIRYGTDQVVALLDSAIAGRNVAEWMPGHDIPVVASLGEALALPEPPDTILIGIAPTGGKLPDAWRATILEAIRAGLNVHSGLHTFLGDDPELAAAAAMSGIEIVDYRRPPQRNETAVGRRHRPGSRVILTVGTDCAIGKMSVALELRKSGVAAGDAAVFVPTGQTGMMIDGWGVAVDRVIGDFVQGTVEWLVEEGEARGDWLIVEGQGSLDHPAYSSVTLGLIHGATPHAMVMVHKPGLAEHDFDHLPQASFPIARLPDFIALHETVAGLVAPSKVVAIAVNTSLYPGEAEARRIIDWTETETGLPAADPIRFGADGLWQVIRKRVDALPWVRENDARGTE